MSCPYSGSSFIAHHVDSASQSISLAIEPSVYVLYAALFPPAWTCACVCVCECVSVSVLVRPRRPERDSREEDISILSLVYFYLYFHIYFYPSSIAIISDVSVLGYFPLSGTRHFFLELVSYLYVTCHLLASCFSRSPVRWISWHYRFFSRSIPKERRE